MLRIHEVTSAAAAKRYFVASDYFSQGQETVGRWGGKLAARLGLSGLVDQASFDRLCDNRHPETGSQLTPRMNGHRRVAYDLVFSGPKAFSVLEALAPDAATRQELFHAFDAAVTETMAEVEADMQTRDRRSGADRDRTTGNLLSASFDHSTARPVGDAAPDPHRHRHVVVFNATWDAAEGRVKAGQFGAIKRDGEYYTAAFYARLAGKLERLGYRIDRSRGLKDWSIAGVPDSLVEKFSKRTGEVEEAHADRLKRDPGYRPEHKHQLGAKTRGRKQKELTPEQLRRAWEAQLTRAERQALAEVYRRKLPKGLEISAKEAVAYAISHCFERDSVVPERELTRVALLYGLGDVTADQIAKELPRQGVIARDLGGRRMAATTQTLAEERFYTGFAASGLGSVAPVGVPEQLTRGRLGDGQWQAVTKLLESSNRVNLLLGPAGAGKSTLLAAFDRGLRLSGRKVTYLATTAAAVEVLRKDGFQAETVARFLVDEKLQDAAQGGRVVIDEASMLSHKDATRFFRIAQAKDLKPVLVGDPMQHGSVAAGATLRVLEKYGRLTPIRLTEIRRQHSARYREAVRLLSQGDTLAGFDALDRLGFVREIRTGDRGHAIAADYLEATAQGKTCLVVSPTHAEGERITERIRRQLRLAGKLGEEREFTRLVAKNLTEAERGDGRNYQPGDVLQFHQHAKGFKNGEWFTLAGEAERATLPLREAAKFQVFRPEAIRLAVGDRVRFTANVKTKDGKHRIANGSTYRLQGFTPGGNLRLENGWVVVADAGHWRHGYVETSFGSQGKTVDRVVIGQGAESLPASNREQLYVSASRAREGMTLYTDSKAELRDAISRSSAKRAASDLLQKPAPSFTDRLREWSQRRRHLAALNRVRAAQATARPSPAERQVMAYGR